MSPDDMVRLKSAYSRALQLPHDRRRPFLEEQFVQEPALLQRTLQLLEWDGEAEDFLETPLADRLAPRAAGDLHPRRIGPYEILRQLGTGGSSTVYLARRADDLFEKQVAVKLLNRLAHSQETFRRFQREVQIMARVDHPYIVRLIEAGATGEGLSYIVTEYIDGVRINDYAAALPLPEKLRLFLKVCEGVSAAHGTLVVHRDLKPSNILVSADGTPKILDFGIAVLLDRDWQLTRTGMERMTVCYASPEQLRGEKTMTTSTDVYSLGVLLYQLIAGRVPYDYPEHEIAARVATEDPPSIPGCPRDLESVVRKALQRDPGRRYDSVDRFGNDIQRYLDGSPVAAQGDSTAYRLRKLVRKHWLPVAALTMTFAALAVLTTVSIVSSRTAQLQATRIHALLDTLSNSLYDQSYWVSLRLRYKAERARLPFLDTLAEENPHDRKIARERFNAWRRAGDFEGLPSSMNLGETAQARGSLERAAAIGEALLGLRGWPEDFRRDLALTHIELGSVLLELGEGELARVQFARASELSWNQRVDLESLAQQSRILHLNGRDAEALDLRRRIVAQRRLLFAKDRTMQWEFAGALCSLGELEREMGHLAEAEQSYSEALPLVEDAALKNRVVLDYLWHLARENEEYAKVLLGLGRGLDARKHLERAIEWYQEVRLKEPDSMSNLRALAVCLSLLGGELVRHGESHRGVAMLDAALQMGDSAARQDTASKVAQAELAAIRQARSATASPAQPNSPMPYRR